MPDSFTAIIDQLERQRTAILSALSALRDIDAPPATAPQIEPAVTSEPPVRNRKRFSAASRKRMKEAQKATWAKRKGKIEPPTATQEPSKAKRKISAEGMKRIIAATKKRWRLKRAADKAAQTKKVA